MKPIRVDRHARRRMVQRGITQREVEMVLEHPQRIEPSVKGRQNAFGSGLHGVVRVTFLDTADAVVVITVVRQRGLVRSSP